jgi:hypothetical protein
MGGRECSAGSQITDPARCESAQRFAGSEAPHRTGAAGSQAKVSGLRYVNTFDWPSLGELPSGILVAFQWPHVSGAEPWQRAVRVRFLELRSAFAPRPEADRKYFYIPLRIAVDVPASGSGSGAGTSQAGCAW